MAAPFDWLSLDVVRYCWPGVSCGDAGGWLSGLATLLAAGIALYLPRRERKLSQKALEDAESERERRAAAIIFNDVYVAAGKATAACRTISYSPAFRFWEAETLGANRVLLLDLPDTRAHSVQRLISLMELCNIKFEEIAEAPAGNIFVPDHPDKPNAEGRYISIAQSMFHQCRGLLASTAVMACEVASELGLMCGGQFHEELDVLEDLLVVAMAEKSKAEEAEKRAEAEAAAKAAEDSAA